MIAYEKGEIAKSLIVELEEKSGQLEIADKLIHLLQPYDLFIHLCYFPCKFQHNILISQEHIPILK